MSLPQASKAPHRIERFAIQPRIGIYNALNRANWASEIRKTRPCLVISPDEINRHLRTVMIAPMTTAARACPTRVALTFKGKRGQVTLEQLRAVDRQRLVRKLGRVSSKIAEAVSTVLVEMFARQNPPTLRGHNLRP